jgi:acetyltransferase
MVTEEISMSFKDILVHVDSTPASAVRLRLGLALARRFGARLTGLHVIPNPDVPPYLGAATRHAAAAASAASPGGIAVEVLDDTAVEFPPLNPNLAQAQIVRTRVSRLMKGYRNQPPVDIAGVADVLIRLSQLVADQADIVELDINPLLADAKGVIGLDGRVRVRPAPRPGVARLAIRPYPTELESEGSLPDGTVFHVRPIRPEDEPAIVALTQRMTPEDRRLRFFAPLNEIPHAFAAKLTQIDYDRELALIAAPRDASAIWGVARFFADPDNVRAEFALAVRSDLHGRGIGYLLMQRLIDAAAARGVVELFGDVLNENDAMLKMTRELGFALAPHAQEPGVVQATKRLRT